MIELFTVEDKIVRPTVHCHTISWLKRIMDEHPDDHVKVYAYLFYMTCPNEQLNPYFNLPEEDKEQTIMQDIEAQFSSEEDAIIEALEKCHQMYETPTMRAYKGMSSMIERLAKYMNDTPIVHGRDGNINSLLAAAKNFDSIRNSFKGVAKDLQEEQKASRRRGGGQGAYDL